MDNLTPKNSLFLLSKSDWKVTELDQEGFKRDGFAGGKNLAEAKGGSF